MKRLYKFGIVAGVFFTLSLICYVIVVGMGWFYNRLIDPEDNVFLTAAVVTTAPIFALIGLFCLCQPSSTGRGGADNADPCLGKVLFVVFAVLVISAGILQAVGGVIFLVAGGLGGSSQALSYGIPAGLFGLVGGALCFCSMLICGLGVAEDRYIEGHDDFCSCESCACDCFGRHRQPLRTVRIGAAVSETVDEPDKEGGEDEETRLD